MAIIPEKVHRHYLQRARRGEPGSWALAAGLVGTATLQLREAACTALPPVVFILAIQSEGRRKSPKEWLVAGSK